MNTDTNNVNEPKAEQPAAEQPKEDTTTFVNNVKSWVTEHMGFVITLAIIAVAYVIMQLNLFWLFVIVLATTVLGSIIGTWIAQEMPFIKEKISSWMANTDPSSEKAK